MRVIAALFGAILAVASVQMAQAAPASIVATLVGQPTLTSLGFSVTASGGASLDNSGPLPVLTATVTGVSPIPGGELILATTSVLTFDSLSGDQASVTDFVLNTALGLLFGDLTFDPAGAPPATVFNNLLVATVESDGDVLISADVADLLASVGLRGAEGFVIARIEPEAVPAPAGLLVFGLGLALLGATKARRPRLA